MSLAATLRPVWQAAHQLDTLSQSWLSRTMRYKVLSTTYCLLGLSSVL